MAGYSGTPLQKKLGIKAGMKLFVLDPPEKYFTWISPLPADVVVVSSANEVIDFIHLFAVERKKFEKAFVARKKNLAKDGMMWISWPKKSSRVVTDLDENVIREFGLAHGLVDVKVCAIDETWSALKFVYRVSDR